MQLSNQLSGLPTVGKKITTSLKRLGLTTVEDLLYYFPFRYEDYRHLVPISQLEEGFQVTIKARLELINAKRSPRKRLMITEALVADETGEMRVVWFNQPFIAKTLKAGDVVFLSGTVKKSMLGPELVSPAFEKVKKDEHTAHTARLVPMYPLTSGITQKQLRHLVDLVVPLANTLPDWLPEELRVQEGLTSFGNAIRGIHFPSNDTELAESTERLKFDELFLLQLQAELTRLEKISLEAPEIQFQEEAIKAFVAELPFALTKTQKVAAWEILQSIQKKVPMNRLLSGDVGSGKTVVAAMALYNAALDAFQSILMVPTEILGTQHYESLVKVLGNKGVRIALFTRSQRKIYNRREEIGDSLPEKALSKNQLLKSIKEGEVDVVIGTHALLSEGVEFKKLGLVIVDEQHRFGVEQRRVIKEKGERVHFLSMTATPIPRSLALMVYGDLDISIINELPPGRKQIITRLVDPHNREKAYEFIHKQVKDGRQVFVVCPLIEESVSDTGLVVADKKSVLSEYKKLSEKVFPDLRVSFLHGKLKADEKEAIMGDFKKGQIDILVATSVIEVGVNIPNASVMMIEGAERFGLAQLHQFRGRVGRSDHQSYCFLFTDSDATTAKERLTFFEAHHDGFKLAEKDLEIRGPGEVYGTMQSGMAELRLAKLTDRELIKKAKTAAVNIAPLIKKYPTLLKKVKEWESRVHLE
jgi:ATP-dependent DNA helicase RecG